MEEEVAKKRPKITYPQSSQMEGELNAGSQAGTDNTERCIQMALHLMKRCPPNTNLSDFMRFSERLIIDDAKQDEVIRKITQPFKEMRQTFKSHYRHTTGPGAAEATRKTIDEDVSVHIVPEDGLEDAEVKRLLFITKLKANIMSAFRDKDALKGQAEAALGCIKTLRDGFIGIVDMNGATFPTKEREIIAAAAICIFNVYSNCKDIHELTLSNTGLDFLVQYLVDLICRDFTDCGTATERCEFVSEMIVIFNLEDFRHYVLDTLTTAVKASLNRINRTIRRNGNNGVLDMNEINTLFNYFQLMEQIVLSLKSLTAPEVIGLKSIERASLNAIPYRLIGFNAAKVAGLAETRSPEYKKYTTNTNLKQPVTGISP